MKGRFLATVAAALLACVPRAEPAGSAPPPATSVPPSVTAGRGGAMTIRFLDVGQGDAALVTTSDGHAVLVDAGPSSRQLRERGDTAAEGRVAAALASLGATKLDAVVLSHAHADHLGDLESLAPALPLGRWIDAGYGAHAVPAYARTLAALEARHVPAVAARRGDRFAIGGEVEASVLEPRAPLFERTRSDLNANSVVLRLVHHARPGDVAVLFEGDAEYPTEERLLADERAGDHDLRALRADVLKVAHHGSKHASSAAMLDAVSPRLAVISCGRGNDYGHPHASTLRRLATRRVAIARTDLEGEVTVTSDDAGLRWRVAREVTADDLLVPGVERAEAP